MAKEEKKKHSLEEKGYQFLIDNPSYSKVIVTSDGSIFTGDAYGENCALNHARTLEDKNLTEVTK